MNVHTPIATRQIPNPRGGRRNVAPKTASLALQGSGTHGAFSWGVIDKLLEDGRIAIEAISATGGASFNAVVFSSAMVEGGSDDVRERLEKFWHTLSRICAPFNPVRKMPLDAVLGFAGASVPIAHRWFETVTQVLGPHVLNPLNYNPFQAALEETLDVDTVCRVDAPTIALGATNVRNGRRRTFANRDVTVDAVLASSCMPTLFHAVEIEGEPYWDGGYSGGPSILPLCCGGNRDVLLSHIHPIERRETPAGATAIRDRICEIASETSLAQELRMLAFAARLAEDNWIRPERNAALGRIRLHMLRSDDVTSDLSVASRFETDWRALTHLRDLGRQAAELWLDANFDRVGLTSTARIEF
jgi:NTE family protein